MSDTTMPPMIWEEPPPRLRGRFATAESKWVRLLAPLRDYPERWANFGPQSSSTATTINRGKVGGLKPGEFEAVTRNQTDGKGNLYVRYIGDAR